MERERESERNREPFAFQTNKLRLEKVKTKYIKVTVGFIPMGLIHRSISVGPVREITSSRILT